VKWFASGVIGESNEFDERFSIHILTVHFLDDLSIGTMVEPVWESTV
jgi:hypothetical protein